MAKLYFRHGTVGSAKTLNLLAVAHNYRQQNKKVLLIKPALDNRFDEDAIQSRAGLHKKADLLVTPTTVIDLKGVEGNNCILVDEAQFLSQSVIWQLREISWSMDIPVICYGLRTDFRTELFEASRCLLQWADSIEEIKTTCTYCNKKAIFNLKHKDGVPTVKGPAIDLGSEEKYVPTCTRCYFEQLDMVGELKGFRDRYCPQPSV